MGCPFKGDKKKEKTLQDVIRFDIIKLTIHSHRYQARVLVLDETLSKCTLGKVIVVKCIKLCDLLNVRFNVI